MVVVGITGGIGSGKGLATEFFRSRGAPIIDADEIARELTQPGCPLLGEIAAEFGEDVLLQDGTLDRQKMASVAFCDPDALARLNAVTHPPIKQEIRRRVEELLREGEAGAVFVVAPLLLEAGLGRAVDRVLVMAADEEERVRRVMARDGVSAEDVRKRIRTQMPPEEERRQANWVVDTTRGGREEVYRQLDAIWRELNR